MPGKVYYRKLIRDKIPEKMTTAGAEYETRVLDESEFARELVKKVEEEASGMAAATTREEFVEELADVRDVLEEVMRVKGISDGEVRAAQDAAREKKGGFEKRLFLEWSADDGYKTNEKRNA